MPETTVALRAARALTRRRRRETERRFLAEGPQAVREALAHGSVRALFGIPQALEEVPDPGVPVRVVTATELAGLSETVTPQGLVAVCDFLDVDLATALASRPRLVVVCHEIRDPGNAGTVLRTADAAGADAVVFAGASVDPYNGKCVRSSAGSLFHVPIVRDVPTGEALDAVRGAGLRVLAATGTGEIDLFAAEDELSRPTAWLFGNEARGLPADLAATADARIRIPILGRAESLNLAAAAAICLYASARAHPRPRS